MPNATIAPEFAIDIHFSCPKCGQQLVVERAGAGTDIHCPCCSKVIQIPTLAEVDPHVEELLETWRNHARNSARELKKVREHFNRAQKDLRKREESLAQALDQLHVQTAAGHAAHESLQTATSKLDWLTRELAAKSEDLGRLSEQLKASKTECESLRAAAKEQQAEVTLVRQERDALKDERVKISTEAKQTLHGYAALQQEHAAALHLTRQELDEARSGLAALQAENNALKAEASQWNAGFEHLNTAHATLQADYQTALETIEHQTIELTLAKQDGIAQREFLGQADTTHQQLRTQLEQTRAELEKTESQLQKLRTERAQFTLQDQQTLREMSKVREQLSLVQFERERVLDELKKTKEKLKSTQSARDDLSIELSHFKSRSHALALAN